MTTQNVPTLREGPRGCGHRKAGGLYIVADGIGGACGKLPLPLHRCPTCDGGIKPSRGWTWITPSALFADVRCAAPPKQCIGCTLSGTLSPMDGSKHGLLWIGESFYPTPGDWLREVRQMGVSRRIAAFPKGLVPGETWVFVAHRLAADVPCDCTVDDPAVSGSVTCDPDPACESCGGLGTVKGPGVFHVFLAEQVQYVVHGDETERELDEYVKRGIVPVHVETVSYPTAHSPVVSIEQEA